MRLRVPWRLLTGLTLLLLLFFLGSYFYPRLQMVTQPYAVSDAGKTTGRDDLYFQLIKPDESLLQRLGVSEDEWRRKNAEPFVFTVNTHSGDIRDWDLEGRLSVVDEKGTRYPAVVRQTLSSRHHTTWLSLVPRYDQQGGLLVDRDEGYLKFIVQDATPGPEVREFKLELPIEDSSPGFFMAYLLIPLVVAGVLMYTVSPCAMGNFALASVIMTASSGRRQRWVNMAFFGSGYVAALLLGGIAFLVLGSHLDAESIWTRRLELVGGLVMAALGLWLVASPGWGPFASLLNRLHDGLGRRLAEGKEIGPGTSFTLGVGISLGCASCVGIVGLALLMPLLTVMGAASLAVAMAAFAIIAFGYLVPFILVITGLPEGFTLGRRVKLEKWLRATSGVLMLAIAAVFLAGASHLMTSLEWELMGWGQLAVERFLGLFGV